MTAQYDVDEIVVVFPDGQGPIGHHGRQRLVDAGKFPAPPAGPGADLDALTAETPEQVVVTADLDGGRAGVYVLRKYGDSPGTQVVHLRREQIAWLHDVLERHPGLSAPPASPGGAEDRADHQRSKHEIEAVTAKLARLWRANPEMRLGQLVANLVLDQLNQSEPMPALYYLPDADLGAALDGALNRQQ